MCSQKWVDERLTWDPADYNNLTHIIVEANRMWKPEFAIINGCVLGAITTRPRSPSPVGSDRLATRGADCRDRRHAVDQQFNDKNLNKGWPDKKVNARAMPHDIIDNYNN